MIIGTRNIRYLTPSEINAVISDENRLYIASYLLFSERIICLIRYIINGIVAMFSVPIVIPHILSFSLPDKIAYPTIPHIKYTEAE